MQKYVWYDVVTRDPRLPNRGHLREETPEGLSERSLCGKQPEWEGPHSPSRALCMSCTASLRLRQQQEERRLHPPARRTWRRYY